MAWQQLTVETEAASAESLAEALSALGAQAVTYQDASDTPLLEPGPGEAPLWERVHVVGLFDADADLGAVRAALRTRCGAVHARSEPLAERDWTRAWMERVQPMRFGERLWIVPTGYAPPAPEAVNIRLDPGLAFGTGTHATTALCLEWLDGASPAGARVLDYGCGSGVLAIAAARLGAAHVWATDNDPQALEATRENARLNGVRDRLTVAFATEAIPTGFDVTLANILAGVLVELAPVLTARTRRGGVLVLSGIREAQRGEVEAAYAPAVPRLACAGREGWVRLAGTRAG